MAMSVTDKPRMERDFLFGERGKTQGHSRQHGHPDHMGHSEQPDEALPLIDQRLSEHCEPHSGQGDLRFEPASALTDHDDGLRHLRTIVTGAPARLAADGWLLLAGPREPRRAGCLPPRGYGPTPASRAAGRAASRPTG